MFRLFYKQFSVNKCSINVADGWIWTVSQPLSKSSQLQPDFSVYRVNHLLLWWKYKNSKRLNLLAMDIEYKMWQKAVVGSLKFNLLNIVKVKRSYIKSLPLVGPWRVGLVVSVLPFYSDVLNSTFFQGYNISIKKQKEAEVDLSMEHFSKKMMLNCQTNLFFLHELSLLLFNVIYTTAYHLGLYEFWSPSTKHLHDLPIFR